MANRLLAWAGKKAGRFALEFAKSEINAIFEHMQGNVPNETYTTTYNSLLGSPNAKLIINSPHTLTILDKSNSVSAFGSNQTDWTTVYENRASIISALATGSNTDAIYENYESFDRLTLNEINHGMVKAFTHGANSREMLKNPDATSAIVDQFHLANLTEVTASLAGAKAGRYILANSEAVSKIIGYHRENRDHQPTSIMRTIAAASEAELKPLVENIDSVKMLISGNSYKVDRAINGLIHSPNTPEIISHADELKDFYANEKGGFGLSSHYSGRDYREEATSALLGGSNAGSVLNNLDKVKEISERLTLRPFEIIAALSENKKGEQILMSSDAIIEAIENDPREPSKEYVGQGEYAMKKPDNGQLFAEYLNGSKELPIVGKHTSEQRERSEEMASEKAASERG